MKKQCFLGILIFICICKNAGAQILCIYCYEQNDSISDNVNNFIMNGGFENNTCTPNFNSFCPNSSLYNCDITNWTCINGGNATYSTIVNMNTMQIVEGSVAAYLGNGSNTLACSATFNDTSCINNFPCTVTGIPVGYPISGATFGGTVGVSLEQTVNGLIPGNTYVLEFWAGGEYDAFILNKGLFAVNIGFGDTLMRNKPTSSGSGIGTRYIIEFNAISASHNIKFTNWGRICSSCTELVFDDVRLYTLSDLSPAVPHCSLGINDVLSSRDIINISPNPITNELNIKTNSNEPSEIIIYDIYSRKLLRQKFTNSISINTEQLIKGSYLFEVRNKNGVVKNGNLIKE